MVTDTEIVNWLEAKAKSSYTGVSVDFKNIRAEHGEPSYKGFRLMSFHNMGEPKKTFREAVIDAMDKEN